MSESIVSPGDADRDFRRRIHDGLRPIACRMPELVGENFAAAIPRPSEMPLSANQIFKRMDGPRFRNVRYAECELDFWFDQGEIEIIKSGHMSLYRWKT